jgi:peroxiredoxin
MRKDLNWQGLLVLVSLLAWRSAASALVKTGEEAPDFTLQQLDGPQVSLSDFRGKVVLINLFGYNCSFCLAGAATIEKVWQDYQESGNFVLLGVDIWNGTARQVDAIFRQGTKTTYPLLLEGAKVGRQYELDRENYIVVDHEGVIRYVSDWRGKIGVRFDDQAVRQAIAQALQDIPAPEPEPETPPAEEEPPAGGGSAVAPASWGGIKSEELVH